MARDIAILAGHGDLPQLLANQAKGALFVTFAGVDVTVPKGPHLSASFEKLGTLFEQLHQAEIKTVVFAGAMRRPALNPANFDAKMMSLAPRLMAAMGGGDDGLLREVVAVFEEEGFAVVGAHEIAPLTADAGVLGGVKPDDTQAKDAIRGRDILHALGPQDVGQACVVAKGLCFGIETIQGTDKLLKFVAETRNDFTPTNGGVLVKRAKPNQDLRIDMPLIGPATIEAAQAAGLSGICLQAGRVMILERDRVTQLADAHGIALWAVH